MLFPLFKRQVIRGFQAHIDAGLRGATDYVAPVGTPIYSPFYGTIYRFQEAKGGNWIGIKRNDGLRFEFAHLSDYILKDGAKCIPGQEIALSGNTGTETTGPHVHHQIIDQNNNRIDPEQFYTPTNIPLIAVSGLIPYLQEFQSYLLSYSAGMLTCSWDIIQYPLSVGMGMLTQEEAYQIVDKLADPKYLPYRYIFLFYNGNISSSFLATYYYPAKNNCISTIPNSSPARSTAFEFSHQLQTFYNSNRGQLPPIQVVDSNFPTDDLIISKYRSIEPFTDILLRK